MNRDIKNIFILGAMKSGTSTLFDYLSQHQNICIPVVKEPNLFLKHKSINISQYLSFFNIKKDRHLFTLEASTSYSKKTEGLELDIASKVKEMSNDCFFIYILRNPLDRIESHYNFMKNTRGWNHKIDSNYLIDVSKYYFQIEDYVKLFKKEKVLLLDFNELKSDPEKVYNRTIKFLGISKCSKSINFNVVKNETLPDSKVKNYLRNTKLNGMLGKKTSNIIRWVIDIMFKPKQKTKLTLEQRIKIKEDLNDDMLKLEEEFEFNVKQWGFG